MQHLGEPIHIHQVEATDGILTSEYIVYDSEGTEAARGKSSQTRNSVTPNLSGSEIQPCLMFVDQLGRPLPPTVLEEEHAEAFKWKTQSTRDTESIYWTVFL